MELLSDVTIGALPDSPFVKPFRINYTQNGKRKTWDLLKVHDSVAVVIFNISRKVMIFVKQFRPAVYYASLDFNDITDSRIDTNKYPASLGIALEVCAGIIDSNKSTIEIAQQEVLEETGYHVPLRDLELVSRYRSGVGVQGAFQTLYFCEVTDVMKVRPGGGVDDELIEVVEMTIPQIEDMILSKGPLQSPPSCLFSIMWFLHFKADKYRKSFERYCVDCKHQSKDFEIIKGF